VAAQVFSLEQAAYDKAREQLAELDRQREAHLAELDARDGEAMQPHEQAQSPRLAADIVMVGNRLAIAE